MNLLMAIGTEKNDVAHRVFATLCARYVAVKARRQAAVSANLARQFDEVAPTHPQRLRAFIPRAKVFLAPFLYLVVRQAKALGFIWAKATLYRTMLRHCHCSLVYNVARPAPLGFFMSRVADTLPAVHAKTRFGIIAAALLAHFIIRGDTFAATRTRFSRQKNAATLLIMNTTKTLCGLVLQTTICGATQVSKEICCFGHQFTSFGKFSISAVQTV